MKNYMLICLAIEKFNPIVTELFIWAGTLNISLVFLQNCITQSQQMLD